MRSPWRFAAKAFVPEEAVYGCSICMDVVYVGAGSVCDLISILVVYVGVGSLCNISKGLVVVGSSFSGCPNQEIYSKVL
jgi:hypothetical protein